MVEGEFTRIGEMEGAEGDLYLVSDMHAIL